LTTVASTRPLKNKNKKNHSAYSSSDVVVSPVLAQRELPHLKLLLSVWELLYNRKLLDHLIGAQQDRWGYGKTERLGGPEIHGKLDG
jgi:hypothetical protein